MMEDLPLPRDKMPKCWEDDTRMNALFAPFRMKSVNPESWDMKMKFWSDVIQKRCSYTKVPVFSVKEFKQAFTRKGRTPACLDIVVEENVRLANFSPISKYMTAFNNDKEGWVRWGVRQAFKPAGLAVSALTTFLPFSREPPDGIPSSNIDPNERFICEDALSELAKELQDSLPPEDRIGTMQDLMEASGHQDKETFLIIVGYLLHHGKAVKRGEIIKIGDSRSKVTPISEQEESLVKLLQAERRLMADVERFNGDVEKAQSDAKSALKLGNKSMAKGHLRRKHVLMDKVIKTENALDNVRQLLFSVRQASQNTDILDTYKVSLDAMKQNMKKSNLDEDSVAETMDELKEILDIQSEIEKSLSATIDDGDTADLERELSELMAEDATSKQADGRTDKQATPGRSKKPSETSQEFVFDGEARVLAELNELGFDEPGCMPEPTAAASGKPQQKAAAVKEGYKATSIPPRNEGKSKNWYPKSGDSLKATDGGWSEGTTSARGIPCSTEVGELKLDNRLHPGQSLDNRTATPAGLYTNEFVVQDHRLNDGVWVYNASESGSPTAPGANRSLAPGSERRNPASPWEQDPGLDDIERRLKNLRQL